MIESLGRRLRVVFHRPTADQGDGAVDPPVPAVMPGPLVDLVVYAEDCILSGRVRLNADRLTDMLNQHDEFLLVDVMVETFDGSGAIEVKDVLVKSDEIVLAHTTGPRGSQARRQRTRQYPVAIWLGDYQVRGYLHALPGSDPLTSIRRRMPMVPLTDASVEYTTGTVRQRRRVGVVVINREHVDIVASALDHEVGMPDLPLSTEPTPLPRDFTGQILRDSAGS